MIDRLMPGQNYLRQTYDVSAICNTCKCKSFSFAAYIHSITYGYSLEKIFETIKAIPG
jgi:hypothetical protein